MAFLKSQLGAGVHLPDSGTVFVSLRDADKEGIVPTIQKLVDLGFSIVATSGTAAFLEGKGLPVSRINKVLEGQPHIVDAMINGKVQLVFNTTEGAASLADSASIRRTAVNGKIPYFTTLASSIASVQAIESKKDREISVRALQSA